MLVAHDKNVVVGPKRVDTKPAAWCNNNNSNSSQIIVAGPANLTHGVTSAAAIAPTSVTLIPSISTTLAVNPANAKNASRGSNSCSSAGNLSSISNGGTDSSVAQSSLQVPSCIATNTGNLLYSGSFQNHHHQIVPQQNSGTKTYQTLSSIDTFDDSWQHLEEQHVQQHVVPAEIIHDPGDPGTTLDLAHHVQFVPGEFEAVIDEQYEYMPGYYSLEALPPHEAFEGGLLFYSDGVGPMEVISNDDIGYQNSEFIHTDGETFYYQPFYEAEVAEAIPQENTLNYSYYLQQCCERSKDQNSVSSEFVEAPPKVIYESDIPVPVLQTHAGGEIEEFQGVNDLEETTVNSHGRYINRRHVQPLLIQTEVLSNESFHKVGFTCFDTL